MIDLPHPHRSPDSERARSVLAVGLAPIPGAALAPAIQATTPSPGAGPDELVEVWPGVVRFGWFLAGTSIVVVLGLYVLRPAVVRVVRRRNPNNSTLIEAIGRYVSAAVLVVAALVGGVAAGYGGILGDSAIVIAAATLAVGVAGQEVIGSLVSGLALVVDPEFSVGSYIEWSDGRGTVQSITLRVTRVLSPDGELVTVPNTVLASQTITRPFSRGRYRVVERIGLGYEADLDEGLRLVREVASDVDGILDVPPPSVYVDELGDDAVVVTVHYWIDDPTRGDVFAVGSAFARALKARLDRADVTLSPPAQRDLRGRIAIEAERHESSRT